jgi:hypothetical protein
VENGVSTRMSSCEIVFEAIDTPSAGTRSQELFCTWSDGIRILRAGEEQGKEGGLGRRVMQHGVVCKFVFDSCMSLSVYEIGNASLYFNSSFDTIL